MISYECPEFEIKLLYSMYKCVTCCARVSQFTGPLMVEDVRNYIVTCCFLHNMHTFKNDEKLFTSRFIIFELNSSVSVKQLRDVVAARES